MKLGIVGLPNVGKSTLFNCITNAGALAANYPFATIEPNVGIAVLKDERLDTLETLYNSKKKIYATVEFVDIAGLVKGASLGEGLGNKFLSHIREVNAIVHVVRCFENKDIVRADGSPVNPISDAETINLELILADIETLDSKSNKISQKLKSQVKEQREEGALEIEVLNKVKKELEAGKLASQIALNDLETKIVNSFHLLTIKPMLFVGNVNEADAAKDVKDIPLAKELETFAKSIGASVITISAKIEEELNGLEEDEKTMFLEELGLKERALDKLIKAGYALLGLISFLTAGEQEVRAWTIVKGTKAPQAAGVIHTDFEKGFIRAETINFVTLME
ncbi:MAG: redox-regulated ATPase YchF, partial [Firmicutes bacterium]|nr:redox-regulated ATPase YchF [Bacillota bacterium]